MYLCNNKVVEGRYCVLEKRDLDLIISLRNLIAKAKDYLEISTQNRRIYLCNKSRRGRYCVLEKTELDLIISLRNVIAKAIHYLEISSSYRGRKWNQNLRFCQSLASTSWLKVWSQSYQPENWPLAM